VTGGQKISFKCDVKVSVDVAKILSALIALVAAIHFFAEEKSSTTALLAFRAIRPASVVLGCADSGVMASLTPQSDGQQPMRPNVVCFSSGRLRRTDLGKIADRFGGT
jgi:hypothetical protein